MFLFALVNRIATRQRQRRVTIQLGALSNRQLNDLGLSRLDILEATHRR